MKLLILNGPNINLLGVSEPEIYGTERYETLCKMVADYAASRGAEAEIFQSNHEGDLVDKIQAACGNTDGIVLNAGAYTHTSVALLDALIAVGIPTVEVHISDLSAREPFRQVSYLRAACVATIMGHGLNGYIEAMALLLDGETK